MELAHQTLKGLGALDGIEILALQVLDQRELGRGLVIDIANDGWNVREAGDLRGAPSALAGDEFIPPAPALHACTARPAICIFAQRPHDNRLHHPADTNGTRQGVDGILIEMLARLMSIRLDRCYVKFDQTAYEIDATTDTK
jgi:hypothetical protein